MQNRSGPRAHLLSLIFLSIFFTMSAVAENEISSIRITSRMDLNAILITEVDLVFIYDQQLADQLPTQKGEWYTQKYDLVRNETSGLDIVTIYVPQGFDSENVNLPERATDALRVFAVGYHEALETPVHDLSDQNRVLVEIDAFGILVSELP
jgi:hypothetical protein